MMTVFPSFQPVEPNHPDILKSLNGFGLAQSARGLAHSKTLRAGRAGSPLPAAGWHGHALVYHDGAQGTALSTNAASEYVAPDEVGNSLGFWFYKDFAPDEAWDFPRHSATSW
jgi:hypothetical protein